MTVASVTELKANLSSYLRRVKRGDEIDVLERGRPIARLLPAVDDSDGDLDRLVSLGLVTPGHGDSARILNQPPIELPVSISEALEDERADRA